MGICLSCNSKFPLENKIKEAWEETEICKIFDSDYVFKIITLIEEQEFEKFDVQEAFFMRLLTTSNFTKLFAFLKDDIVFLFNNDKGFHVLISFLFLTKSKNHLELKENLDILYEHLGSTFKKNYNLEVEKRFFKEIIEIYINIISKYSYECYCKSENKSIEKETDSFDINIIDAFSHINRVKLIEKLFSEREFRLTNFIKDNYEKLKPDNVREELLNLVKKKDTEENTTEYIYDNA